eukprot:TRINITY_DN2821_c0_g2_i4.p1 TRINITY_DN2821_c0_g2~~TRINITY_DN2821_c0_g2_i4.p1  ORF type:complete len:328 (-),score=21.27 TRINITY_DN2821_c0_g2_i4:19-1002(-)
MIQPFSDHLVYPILVRDVVKHRLRSEHVCQVVYNYVNLFDPEARKKLFHGSGSGQGLVFEAYFRTVLGNRDLSFRLLTNDPHDPTLTFLTRLGNATEWYSDIPKDIRMDTVYCPKSEVNPMFDFVYVSEDPQEQRYHVVAVQVTLASKHLVKPAGFPLLSSVVDGLTQKDYKVRFHLMFATPGISGSHLQPSYQCEKFGGLNKPQTIVADPSLPIDPATFCVTQWVLGVSIGADVLELNDVLGCHGTDVAQTDVETPGPREMVENGIRRIQKHEWAAALDKMTIKKMTAYLSAIGEPALKSGAPKPDVIARVTAALLKQNLSSDVVG